MRFPSGTEQLVRLFRHVASTQPAPPVPHPVEDEELLTCWSLGQLTRAEQEKFVDHLSACHSCRLELADMIRIGVVSAPENARESAVDGGEIEMEPMLKYRPRLRDWLPRLILGMAAAAAILVGVGLFWFRPHRDGAGAVLAQAEAELQQGQPFAALARLEELLPGPLNETDRGRARKLLEEAGYQHGRTELAQARFQEVEEITRRLDQEGVKSARIRNLQLQAAHKIPAEVTLAYAGSLTAYGHDLDGLAPPWKALPIIDKETQQREQQWKQLIAEHPHDVTLHLNYGQFLLSLSRFDQARQQFAQALAEDPGSAAAEIGLGLLAFEGRKYADALQHFQAALRIDPENPAAEVNTAICLERLDRPNDARQHWQRARDLVSDEALRQRIEKRLAGERGGK